GPGAAGPRPAIPRFSGTRLSGTDQGFPGSLVRRLVAAGAPALAAVLSAGRLPGAGDAYRPACRFRIPPDSAPEAVPSGGIRNR
ncbi:MAG: hypothetical protein J2P25_01955, partial [Nocardiopsaceae bacterium]|nr:hypothetical protein [Nocardiopsaceae bacterium]